MAHRKFEMIGGRLVQTGGDPVTAQDERRYRDNIRGICESHKAPGGIFDDTGFKHLAPAGAEMPDRLLKNKQKVAANRGVKFDPSKPYNPMLAAFPGDPRAQVTSRSELKRRLNQMGQNVGSDIGSIWNPTPRNDIAPAKRCKLNPRIANRILKERVQEDPGLLQRKRKREVLEQIVHEHGSK